tara:strand:+ start:170 stop:346 length:177 start_codon:yes stop_codon:yes gene_type:complete
MLVFFLLTVVGGFLKFIISYFKDEIETIDVIAVVYSIGLLIATIIYYCATGENVFDFL